MKTTTAVIATMALLGASAHAQGSNENPKAALVTVDNFIRAESDRYFASVAGRNGFGKLQFTRALAPIGRQTVIRMNRDTLYGAGVFDLDAGPVTVTLPDTGARYLSMQVVSQDHYTLPAFRAPGTHTITREQVGTRYAVIGIRVLVDANDAEDIRKGNVLQDAVQVSQKAPGTYDAVSWDAESQKRVRDALLVLGSAIPDSRRMFGGRAAQLDPVRHLIGSATLWGGLPEQEALYLNFMPSSNDGKAVYRLDVGDVPADGFWSISVYNAKGYFEPNARNAYAINNVTAKKSPEGRVVVQFGGCADDTPNCLPTTDGWNYTVRLYRPRAEAITGAWTLPKPQLLGSP
ncbi:DUF1214 domain-containing protein [Variovorax sp. dw_308]|uniref:DUF1214 domain-containing protein n=1 Tax=Variovorax sp. dw_308 TaxID=2721546 RepID=UPI001C48102E|nr:DUF1214 domain-containing protein [Variovorax sp. dw_308]